MKYTDAIKTKNLNVNITIISYYTQAIAISKYTYVACMYWANHTPPVQYRVTLPIIRQEQDESAWTAQCCIFCVIWMIENYMCLVKFNEVPVRNFGFDHTEELNNHFTKSVNVAGDIKQPIGSCRMSLLFTLYLLSFTEVKSKLQLLGAIHRTIRIIFSGV